jgi:hypothetical protein
MSAITVEMIALTMRNVRMVARSTAVAAQGIQVR